MNKKNIIIDTVEAEEALANAKLNGLKKQLNADSWSNQLEDLMKEWGEKAAGLRYIHEKSAGSWKKFSNNLTLFGILVSTLASTLSLSTASLDNVDNEYIIMYTVGGISLLSTFIQSLKKFYESEEKAADHKSISKQFGSFYRYMTLQLGMSRYDRRNSDDLTEWALRELERLQLDAPSLNGKIIKEFKDKFQPYGQSMPDICQDKFIITIFDRINNKPETINNEPETKNNEPETKNNEPETKNNEPENN